MYDFENTYKSTLKEIEFLCESIDQSQFLKIVELVSLGNFDHIVGFGAGRMGYALKAYIMRMCHIGYEAYMIGDTNFPKIGPKTVVFVNSSSGETPTSILYTQQARNAGATIIGVTQNANSSIGQISDHLLQYAELKSNQIMKTLPEQFTFVLFDLLAEAIITKTRKSRTIIAQNHSISE